MRSHTLTGAYGRGRDRANAQHRAFQGMLVSFPVAAAITVQSCYGTDGESELKDAAARNRGISYGRSQYAFPEQLSW